MCLGLDIKKWRKQRKEFRSRPKPIKVWKALVLRVNPQYHIERTFQTPHRKVEICDGINRSSRKSTAIVNGEINMGVDEGLHFFIQKKAAISMAIERAKLLTDAVSYLSYSKFYPAILPVWIDPKDVVAVGDFNGDFNDERSLVATKANYNMKKIIEIESTYGTKYNQPEQP